MAVGLAALKASNGVHLTRPPTGSGTPSVAMLRMMQKRNLLKVLTENGL